MDYERINVHPLVNTMTTGVQRDDLVRFLASTGHEPRIVPLDGVTDSLAHGTVTIAESRQDRPILAMTARHRSRTGAVSPEPASQT